MLEILLSVLLLGTPTSAPDTVFQVRRGDELVLRNFSGAVEVEVWDRDEVFASADSEGSLTFRTARAGQEILLEVLDRKRRNRTEDLTLRVPSWIDLDISGPKVDVGIRGLRSHVRIRALKGDLELADIAGTIEASTVEGSIDAVALEGYARLKTGHDDISIEACGADLVLETVSGDISLSAVVAQDIEARTTDGDVDFQGRFLPGGTYAFRSHGGELGLVLEPPVDADVTVLVYEGEFDSDFPIRTKSFHSGKDLQFTIGEGGSQVLLEAFDGEVTLRRGNSGRWAPDPATEPGNKRPKNQGPVSSVFDEAP